MDAVTSIDGLSSAASALSPSGRLLAIANLNDGIDWYSIKERIYLSSTQYEGFDEDAYVPGIDFIDERTVVVGACGGQIKFASHGRGMNPPSFTLRGATEGTYQHAPPEVSTHPSALHVIQTFKQLCVPQPLHLVHHAHPSPPEFRQLQRKLVYRGCQCPRVQI